MMQEAPSGPPSQEPAPSGFGGCALVIFRMLVGPGLIFVAGAVLIKDKLKLGSVWDFIFLGAVAATIGAALLTPDAPALQPLKPGEAAPLSRSRYVALTLGGAVLWFCFAHFVAPRLF